MKQAYISDLAIFLPHSKVTNSEVENRIVVNGTPFQEGLLRKIFGSRFRYFADEHVQVSDLAAAAGNIILERTNHTIDLLIFAAASSDLIEPATSNIIQQKMGLACPVMDIKNACNSVVTAIETASAFVVAGMYENVLIVNGEKLSEVINYHPRDNEHLLECLSGYTLGDAGAAVLVSCHGGSPIHFQRAMAWGEHWELCTVAGGGSRSFRDADKYYFEGKTAGLRNAFEAKALPFILQCIEDSPWAAEEIDCFVTHQVSFSTSKFTAKTLGIDDDKCINVFEHYGNTAAASIPLALDHAIRENRLKKGDKLMILGLAAGISVSVQLITW
jgi:3-oxoacyl-(acyl-carrier-protein) synthase III